MDTGAAGSSPDPGPPEGSIVRVVGELDLASAPELRDRIARAADDPTCEVVVDLSGVSFVDCAGLGALLTAQAQLGSRLSLRGPSTPFLWLIELTRLRVVFGSRDGGMRAVPRPKPAR
jgi:anti-anti-sigma factor